MCLFLRFLPPNGHLLALANKRVYVLTTVPIRDSIIYTDSMNRQSFMYYGAGSPCGYLRPGDEKIMIPEFTSPLYIFPDLEDRNQYRWWTLQLLSMTLLEPLSANPNYGIIDPIDWTPQHIPINEQGNGALRGIRVMFDSGEPISQAPRTDADPIIALDTGFREYVLCSSAINPPEDVDAVVQHAPPGLPERDRRMVASQP